MLKQKLDHDPDSTSLDHGLVVCPAQLATRHSVVAPGKSWSNFVVVTTPLVDSKAAVADDWSAKKWRELCVRATLRHV